AAQLVQRRHRLCVGMERSTRQSDQHNDQWNAKNLHGFSSFGYIDAELPRGWNRTSLVNGRRVCVASDRNALVYHPRDALTVKTPSDSGKAVKQSTNGKLSLFAPSQRSGVQQNIAQASRKLGFPCPHVPCAGETPWCLRARLSGRNAPDNSSTGDR